MRHQPTQPVPQPFVLSKDFLHSISPAQSASPSVAHYSAGLAHDARNMLSAMDIYCELLASPGVLKVEDKHLLDELRLLRDSSGQLLDRLLVEALKCLASSDQNRGSERSPAAAELARSRAKHEIDGPALRAIMGTSAAAGNPLGTNSALLDIPGLNVGRAGSSTASAHSSAGEASWDAAVLTPPEPARTPGKRVTDLAAELRSSLPMLSALAGPRVEVSLALDACPEGEIFMPQVDLSRVLINLVRNAAEAMSVGGRILIAASPCPAAGADPTLEPSSVLLSIEDNGPGIPLSLLDRIFDLHVSAPAAEESARSRLHFRPRGLGLRIVREFVETSGGSVRAVRLPDRGSRFEIVLQMVTKVRAEM